MDSNSLPTAGSVKLSSSERSSRLTVLDVFERKNELRMFMKEKELALRERELALQEKKLQLDETERAECMKLEREEKLAFISLLKKHL